MNKMTILLMLMLVLCVSCSNVTSEQKNKKIRALIIDGQNNHRVWPKGTVMMKQYLEETGLFNVSVSRYNAIYRGDSHPEMLALHSSDESYKVEKPIKDANFSPAFSDYDVVISNFGYGAAPWPKATEQAFEQYLKNGGGFVAVHSANNSFPNWQEYNKIVGLSGWGKRNEKHGPYLYYTSAGKLIKDHSKGDAGAHGTKHEFQLTQRNEHPILTGLPKTWMHTKDECYGKLRGPAQNMIVLATALCPKAEKGSGRHEPMLMVLNYGKGRVFHTTLGHEDYSLESVGFITTFLRGSQWAATGEVTLDIPEDFPTAKQSSRRGFYLKQ